MKVERCILCSAKPPPPLTKEDIWPTWYSKMRPGATFQFEGTLAGRGHMSWPAKKLNLAPHVLCGECNNVWGSDLEDRQVKPFLSRMVDGNAHSLVLREMQALAAWLTLKLMVTETMGKDRPWFFTQDQREHLRRKTRAPQDAAIWIGDYGGARRRSGRFSDHRSHLALPENLTQAHPALFCEFTIGQVLLQFFMIQGMAERFASGVVLPPSLLERGNWSTALDQIWPLPSRPIGWPPKDAIGDKAFEALGERWNQDEPE
ncbi:MAG: hypothetical protein WD004_02215 [Actinomycetota bacterium]